MAKQQAKRTAFKCKRCGWQWFSKMNPPTVCPKCHTAYWNQPKGGQ